MSEVGTYANIYVPNGMTYKEAMECEDRYVRNADELMAYPVLVSCQMRLSIINGWPAIIICKSKEECEKAKNMVKLVTLECEGEA